MSSYSIVIPLYNEENNIEKLINEIKFSLLDKFNFEIILVNDGSLDNTLHKIKELIKKNDALKIFFIDNKKKYGTKLFNICWY